MVSPAEVRCAVVWWDVDGAVGAEMALLEILRARRSSADFLEEHRVSSVGMLVFVAGELRCLR